MTVPSGGFLQLAWVAVRMQLPGLANRSSKEGAQAARAMLMLHAHDGCCQSQQDQASNLWLHTASCIFPVAQTVTANDRPRGWLLALQGTELAAFCSKNNPPQKAMRPQSILET